MSSEGQKTDVPDNAPEHCPGTQAENAGKSAACAGCPNQQICASGAAKQTDPDLDAIGTLSIHTIQTFNPYETAFSPIK